MKKGEVVVAKGIVMRLYKNGTADVYFPGSIKKSAVRIETDKLMHKKPFWWRI